MTMNAISLISAGLGFSGANVSWKQSKHSTKTGDRIRSLPAGMRNVTGVECMALGRRVEEESERFNAAQDFYHFAPKLMEMLAFERGEMP